MVVVDTHCHASLDWYEPIETLLHEMDASAVDHAVLVQIRGQFDNEYQFACAQRYPGRFANVVMVDTDRPDAPRQLEGLAERGAGGVRLGPSIRSPCADPLAIWRTADRLGLAVSCGGSSADFAADEFAAIDPLLQGRSRDADPSSFLLRMTWTLEKEGRYLLTGSQDDSTVLDRRAAALEYLDRRGVGTHHAQSGELSATVYANGA